MDKDHLVELISNSLIFESKNAESGRSLWILKLSKQAKSGSTSNYNKNLFFSTII